MNGKRNIARRASVRRLLVAVVTACVVTIVGLLPSPFAVEAPGPVVNTLGEVRLASGKNVQVLEFPGIETYPADGSVNLVTVELEGSPDHPRNWFSLLPALFDPTQQVAPLSLYFPAGMTSEQRQQRDAADMSSSQGAAVTAAFDWLGRPVPEGVRLNLEDIGGPSAGLAFALGAVEKLTPGSMLRGLDISATGTISSMGEVGPIGGLNAKLWAADRVGSDLVLIPVANCDDLPARRPDGLRIVPVATLEEAVTAVKAVAAGSEPAGLGRCGPL